MGGLIEKELNKALKGKEPEKTPEEKKAEASKQCHNCQAYGRQEGRGWCDRKKKNVNRRGTCKKHECRK